MKIEGMPELYYYQRFRVVQDNEENSSLLLYYEVLEDGEWVLWHQSYIVRASEMSIFNEDAMNGRIRTVAWDIVRKVPESKANVEARFKYIGVLE